jgi:hypothetical protein
LQSFAYLSSSKTMEVIDVAFYDDGNYLRVEEASVVRYINKQGVSMQHDRTGGFYIQSDDYKAYFNLESVVAPSVTGLAQLIEVLRLWCSSTVPDLDARKITTGTLEPDRIPGLDAGKITSGVLDASRLPGFADALDSLATLDASGVTTGVFDPERLPGLDASKISSGVLSPELIPPLDASAIAGGVLSPELIPPLDASAVASGVLSAARIPALDASAIASGVLDVARVPVLDRQRLPPLDASQVTSGVLSLDRLPHLEMDAAQVNSGVLSEDRLPALDASKITSGTLAPDRVPPLDASRIATGTLSSDRIPTLDASRLSTGVLVASRLPALDAGKITSGVFSADRIPALDASKVSTGVLDAARVPGLASLAGVLGASQGGTGAAFLTAGKLLVGSGTAPVSAPAGLHWDALSARLGVRTSAPSDALHVAGNATFARCTASNLVLQRGPPPPSVPGALSLFCDSNDGLLKLVQPGGGAPAVMGPFFRNQTGYAYASTPSSLVQTTSSTTLSTKLSTALPGMLAGTYRVAVCYQGFAPVTSKSIRVVAFVDSLSTTFHDATGMYTAGYNSVTHDFCNLTLAAGDHAFVVQYSSPSGAQVGLLRAALEIFRVGD